MTPVLATLVLAAAAGAAVSVALVLRQRPDAGAPQLPHRAVPGRRPSRADIRGTAAALPVVALLVAVAAVGVGSLLVMVERQAGLVRWDDRLAAWASENATEGGTGLLVAATQLGDTWVVATVALAASAYGYVRFGRWAIPLFLTAVVGGQMMLSNLIKWGADRARPTIDPLAPFSGGSFPSGHTTAATATYLAVALVLGLGAAPKARSVLMGAAVALAVSVGCSRVFLGVHWFTDVLAGFLVGWAWFSIVSAAFGGRRLRLGSGVADWKQGGGPQRRQTDDRSLA